MEINFSRKKIGKTKIPTKKLEKLKIPGDPKSKKNFLISLIIPVTIIIILVIATVKVVSSINLGIFLEVAGDDLKIDSVGHTNFLILGTGGKNHEGSDLTDTIMVASLDKEDGLITMISIPRDYYIKDNTVGNSRINEVYYYAKEFFNSEEKGLDHLKNKVEELTGIPIHYWLKIDFAGFKELIDAIGGIDVEVEESIYDPFYPKDGTYEYETFSISKGTHHLDGETALKYARSRKTTSDFDRARRQQQIIYAIKDKALQTEILFSQEHISEIFAAIKENIATNITPQEIFTLGAIVKDYTSDKITHRLIHDDPNQCGGFLYTPDRSFYNEMFVLIAAGSEAYIHWYTDLNLNTPYIKPEETFIHILNGTKNGGVAGETKQVLQRYCFDVVRFGNGRSQDITETTYFYNSLLDKDGKPTTEKPKALDFLQKLIPGKESTEIPEEYKEYMQKAELIIELGSDYTASNNYIEDPFIYLPAPSTETTETTEEEPTTSDTEITADTPTEKVPATESPAETPVTEPPPAN